ncbi:EMB2654 [Symbiodinium natans]|uniref:EMB2654 protein n=1 Tax=Symbiodinium natans TaxID=878477 RepID=A0A812P1Y8_9DINO|nr:EMB2654 [Symbiodinium natans]
MPISCRPLQASAPPRLPEGAAQAHRVQGHAAERLLRSLQQRGCEVTPAEAQKVLASYQKSQQWQHALNVLRFLQNADAINYGAALHACTKSSSWMAASTLVVGMKQLTMEANTILANTLIDGLARLSFWEQPMEQLMAMRHQNLRYNRASFGPAFSAFSSSSPSSSSSSPSSSWQHVLAMLGLARRLRLQPDVVTSGAALHALKNLASWRTPLDFLHCMTTAATLPNTVCLTSAAGSCQDWQNALALSTSRGPGLHQDDVGLSSLVTACHQCHHWQAGLHLLGRGRCRPLGECGLSLRMSVQAFSKQHWETSQQLLRTMRRHSVRKDILTCTSCTASCHTDVAMAWPLAMEAVQAARSEGLWSTHMGSWSSILLIFRQLCGEVWTRALSCVEALSGGELSTAARASLALGMGEQHCSAWAPALALCDSELAELAPGSLTFNAALMACQAGCNFELGLGLLERITRMSAQPHLLSTVSTSTVSFNILLGLCAREQLWEEALGLLGTMASQKVPRNEATFTSALQACEACEADRGQWSQWQRALSWFRDMMEIEPIEPTTIGFTALITTCGNAVQWLVGDPASFPGDFAGYRHSMSCGMSLIGCERKFESEARCHAVWCLVGAGAVNFAVLRSAECERALTLGHVLKVYDATIAKHGISCQVLSVALAVHLRISHTMMAQGGCDVKIWRPQEATVHLADLAKTAGVQSTVNALERMHRQHLQVNVVHFNAAMSARKSHRGQDGWAAAVQVIDSMQSLGVLPSIVSFNQLIPWLSQAPESIGWQCWQSALEVIANARASKLQPTTSTHNAAMSASRRAWNSALELLRGQLCDGLQPDQVTFGAAIAACEGQWQSALMLHATCPMYRLSPDIVSFTSLIRACGSCQQWQMAMAVWAEMARVGGVPNEITFGVAVSACEHGSQWSTALCLLHALTDQRLLVNAIVCSAAISACEKAGCWEAALFLLSSMSSVHGLKVDNLCYNPVIAACAACAACDTAWELALALLHGMPCTSLVPDDYTQTAAAPVLAAKGWRDSLTLAERFGRPFGALSGSPWELAYAGMAAAAARRLQVREAPALAALQSRTGSAGSAGWRRILDLVTALVCSPSLQLGVVTFTEGVAGTAGASSGKWEQALQLAEWLLQEGIDGIESSVITQSSVMAAVGANGEKWRKALAIFRTCQTSQRLQPDSVSYCILSSSFGEAGEWGRALLLHYRERTLQTLQLASFRTVITACERGSQWQCGLEVLESLQAAGFGDINSCSAAISACENCGEWEVALELLNAMLRQELRPDSFSCSAAISACASSGNWQVALQLMACMSDWQVTLNGICLTAVISSCRVSAQWQLACNLLQRVVLHAFDFDEIACTASMGACGQASHWQRASQLLPWLKGFGLHQSEFAFGAAIGACAKGQVHAQT